MIVTVAVARSLLSEPVGWRAVVGGLVVLIGVASVAPGAKILPIKISNASDGVAYYSHMAEGIRWAADHGARVANLSYGAAGSSTVSTAADYMMDKGGVVTWDIPFSKDNGRVPPSIIGHLRAIGKAVGTAKK